MPSSRPQLLRFAGLLLGSGLVAFAGCSSSGTSPISVTHPTMIRVEPEDFLGALPCDLEGPGLKRYVATIVDYNYGEGGEAGAASAPPLAEGGANAGGAPVVTEPDAQGFQAPSSLPTPCTTGVGFGFVVPGRHYEVLIDGYDTADITPRAVGSREMLPVVDTTGASNDDGASDGGAAAVAVHTRVLEPRWQTRCRRAIAADSTIVRADECEPFPADDVAKTGTVRVALSSLLGQLQCGDGDGQVANFRVTGALPDGSAIDQEVPCPVASDAEPAALVLTGVKARAKLSLYVRAFSAEQTLELAGAQCNATAQAGANVEATCAALSKVGTLRVDVSGALEELGGTCSTAFVSSITLTPKDSGDDSPRSLPPPDCEQPFSHGFPVSKDDAVVVLQANLSDGSVVKLSCHAPVPPGQVVAATCEP